MKIYSFEKLDVWQKARKLARDIYVVTQKFPDDEKFGLTSQLRRAAISICSNIAEGSSRNSYKDKARFTEIAYGSLTEVLNQLILAFDLSYLNEENYKILRLQLQEISSMLTALRKSQIQNINP